MFKVTYINGWVSYYGTRPSNYAPEMNWGLGWRLYQWYEGCGWVQIDGRI